jgi:hypothetical protein
MPPTMPIRAPTIAIILAANNTALLWCFLTNIGLTGYISENVR